VIPSGDGAYEQLGRGAEASDVRGPERGRTGPVRSAPERGLDKATRERVKQASRELLAVVKARLAELDRFWKKKQTKADVETFILDEIYPNLLDPPFTPTDKKLIASNVYAYV
jgi:hypothetical protein